MSNYELVYIIQPQLEETALTALNERIQQVIVSNGGEVASNESLGLRTLAYPIKRRREGIYMLLKGTFTQASIAELERTMRLSEDILRHMVVRLDDQPEAPAAETETPSAETNADNTEAVADQSL